MAPNMDAIDHAAALGYDPIVYEPLNTQYTRPQPSGHPFYEYNIDTVPPPTKKHPDNSSPKNGHRRRYGRSGRRGSCATPGEQRYQQQAKKHVHFESSSKNKVCEVDNIADLPFEVIWYTQEEYERIRATNSQIARQVKSGTFVEDDEQTARGLEHKQKDIFKKRRENKFASLNAIMEEQGRQIRRGGGGVGCISDPDAVAAVYEPISRSCAEVANAIGLSDAKRSQNYESFADRVSAVFPTEKDDNAAVTTDDEGPSRKKGGKVKRLYRRIRRRASM